MIIDTGFEVKNYLDADLSMYSDDELNTMMNEELHKKSISHTNQLNRKILINSLYGALGSEYFRFYSRDNAEAVTSFGQVAIKWVQKAVNIYLNKVNNTNNKDYIIYIDTDSIYVDMEDLIKKANKKSQKEGDELIDFVSLICEKMTESVINTCYERLRVFLNNNVSHMNMDREAIAIEGGFFVAKKRYALLVNDNEGVRYHDPKMKLIGIETQRSTTPKAVTTAMKKSINSIITSGEKAFQTVVRDFDS